MNTDRFKAKALTVGDNPEWVEGYPYISEDGRVYIKDGKNNKRFGCGVEVNPDTLCQCTGLQDSQGKLGFDGDHFLNEHGGGFRFMWYIDGWVAVRIPQRTMVRMRDIEFSKCTLTGNNIHDPKE